jgi:hypothetical protein
MMTPPVSLSSRGLQRVGDAMLERVTGSLFKGTIARSGQTLVASGLSSVEASLLPLLLSRETR